MPATINVAGEDIEYRIPAGGSVIYTDELGHELFRVTSVGDAVKINGQTVAGATGALAVAGVAAGYKVARGVHTQVAASDTVVTNLATVVAAVVQFQSAPTAKQLFCVADVGNQAGAPAAGSILVKTFKPTATDNVTPTAATDFTDALVLAWIAVGT